MKIITMDLDSIVLFLSDMDFSLEEDSLKLEDNFRNIFLRLKKIYDIDIQGYYQIDIYKDKFFGFIVDIKKEELDYFDYYNSQVDMQITIYTDEVILYEVDDLYSISSSLFEKLDFYVYCDKIYVLVKDKLSVKEGSSLLEFSHSIIYGDFTKYILHKRNNIIRN